MHFKCTNTRLLTHSGIFIISDIKKWQDVFYQGSRTLENIDTIRWIVKCQHATSSKYQIRQLRKNKACFWSICLESHLKIYKRLENWIPLFFVCLFVHRLFYLTLDDISLTLLVKASNVSPTVFKYGGIFIVPHLLCRVPSVFPWSHPKDNVILVAFYERQEYWTQSSKRNDKLRHE